ncbi:PaeR7I family type II restriction endonuclease [Dickeya dadantii]|uniref:PaeR7I family type II restriction endonuclease n=1 Tax=Dickeya dadantii TaxID=204038 RepID=UPI0021D7DA86|nr:PaeR7I family type II restriction endonuclease [Dickeya dadantii]
MLDLADYEYKTREAIKVFWGNRQTARHRQIESGRADQGERSGVTAGNNMDGFLALVQDIISANGLPHAQVYVNKGMLALPGYFRPTKLWDILVMHNSQLIVAIELKSHIGPSFGNNFNNRTEEALGTAFDLWTAYRNGALGAQPAPFVGWLMLIEDAPESSRSVQDRSPHFAIDVQFQGASYKRRYDILCQRMMQENLYSYASVISSPRSGITTGDYSELSCATGLRSFFSRLAGHVAAEAHRLG